MYTWNIKILVLAEMAVSVLFTIVVQVPKYMLKNALYTKGDLWSSHLPLLVLFSSPIIVKMSGKPLGVLVPRWNSLTSVSCLSSVPGKVQELTQRIIELPFAWVVKKKNLFVPGIGTCRRSCRCYEWLSVTWLIW
jgi:hypothetical protein